VIAKHRLGFVGDSNLVQNTLSNNVLKVCW